MRRVSPVRSRDPRETMHDAPVLQPSHWHRDCRGVMEKRILDARGEGITMTVNTRLFAVSIVALFSWGLVSAPPASAQGRMNMGGQAPIYDTATEVTLKDTVEEVKTVSGMMGGFGRMGMQGTHLVLKSDQDTVDVHLGPSAFLAEKKVEIAKGDAIEVTGSRMTIGESTRSLRATSERAPSRGRFVTPAAGLCGR